MRKVILAVIACFVFAAALSAVQTKSEAVYGIVRDASDDPLPKVRIFLKYLNTKAVSRTATGNTGEFRIEVSPGSYELIAELQGYIPVRVPDLRLNANETINKDLIILEYKPSKSAPPQAPKGPLPEGAIPPAR